MLHPSHDLAKGYALAIFGRLQQAKRDLEHAKQHLETVQKDAQAEPAQVAQTPARVVDCATSAHHWQEVSSAWRLADSIRQTSKEAEEQLRAELKAIEALIETNGLP